MKAKTKEDVMSVRLKSDLSKRLEALAEATERSRSFLAAEAIEQYVDLQEWQIEDIKEGLRDLEAGRSVPHSKVKAMMEKRLRRQ